MVPACRHTSTGLPGEIVVSEGAVLDGRDEPPTVGAMAQLVSEIAATRPDVPALIDERGTTTWEQLSGRVNRLINALRAAGVGQGDTIAMLSRQPARVLRGLPGRRSHGRADRAGQLALGRRRGGLRAGQLRGQGAAGGGCPGRRGRRRARRAARRHSHRRRRRGRRLPALRGRAGRGRRHRAGRPGPGRPDVLHVGHHRLAQGRAQRHAQRHPVGRLPQDVRGGLQPVDARAGRGPDLPERPGVPLGPVGLQHAPAVQGLGRGDAPRVRRRRGAADHRQPTA